MAELRQNLVGLWGTHQISQKTQNTKGLIVVIRVQIQISGGTEVGPGDTNTESDRTKAVPGRTIAEPWQDLTVPGSNGRVGPPLQDSQSENQISRERQSVHNI